uniref:E3 ubiquitin-protein ligase PPP1R11 n=1 Tax=Latimeria chalumnae TaxID=7897 RepID=H2ZS19_LATCH
MAEAPGSSTVTQTLETPQQQTPPETEGRSLTIKLRKRKTEKKVEWTSDTVDNEHMGRRSSKCESLFLR